MALNPNYEAIGKAFTEQYYNMFDNPATRYDSWQIDENVWSNNDVYGSWVTPPEVKTVKMQTPLHSQYLPLHSSFQYRLVDPMKLSLANVFFLGKGVLGDLKYYKLIIYCRS